MPTLKQRVQAAQAAVKAFWGSGNWGSSGRSYWIPGSHVDWSAFAGSFWQNAVAYSCYAYIAKNFTQAPPTIVTENSDGEKQPNPKHPLLALLNQPNPYYDGSCLWWITLLSLLDSGDAYLVPEWTRGGDVGELYWLPHWSVSPKRKPDSRNLIDYYEYQPPGSARREFFEPNDLIHIRHGIDPEDPMHGLSGWAALVKQRASLEMGASYRANILRNNGTLGGVFTTKEKIDDFDTEAFVTIYEAKHTGDKVGRMMAINMPLDFIQPKNSPQDMATETIEDRPEADVCAVFGVPAQCIGVHVGRLSKTYANVKEARESFWEETEIPLLRLVAGQVGAQIERKFKLLKPGERLEFDISDIRPLQPDKDALHSRVREDFKTGLIDLATALSETGRKAKPEHQGVYYPGTPLGTPETEEEPEGGPEPSESGSESENGRERALRAFLEEFAEKAQTRASEWESEFGEMPEEEEPQPSPIVAEVQAEAELVGAGAGSNGHSHE